MLNQANDNSLKTILHLIDTTGPGGAETVFIQLADCLQKLGNKSIVVIRGEGWVKDRLEEKGLFPIVLPAKGSFAVKFLFELIKVIRKEKVGLIQSHLLGSNVYAAIAGIITHTPVVATYHGMVDVNPNERFKGLKNRVMKWGITRYIAVSQSLLQNIKAQNLLVSTRAEVIYNGVDISQYGIKNNVYKGLAKQENRDSIRNFFSIDKKSVLVGSLGNIRTAKAYNTLIESGAILSKQYPELHFVIAGHKKKSIMAKLESLMLDLGVTSRFHFLGFVDDSSNFLSQLDIFCLSSSSEGFSISTIEAMASTLPVVVTKCGGPEEIVISDENALMVPVNNPKALAEAISGLIDDSELARKLANNARQHVENTFSLDKMVNSYNKIYGEIA